MTDIWRAAIIALVNSTIPVLQIFGIANFTAEQIATIMLFVNNLLTFGFLFWKQGQTAG